MHGPRLRDEHGSRKKRPRPSVSVELNGAMLADGDLHGGVAVELRPGAHVPRLVYAKNRDAVDADVLRVDDKPVAHTHARTPGPRNFNLAFHLRLLPLTNRLAFSDFGRDLDYAVCEGEFLGLAVAPGDAD